MGGACGSGVSTRFRATSALFGDGGRWLVSAGSHRPRRPPMLQPMTHAPLAALFAVLFSRLRRRTVGLMLPLPLLLPAAALAQVGVQRLDVADATAAVSALVWYPTQAQAQAQRIGPFALEVAADAAPGPAAGRRPLLLVSHGTGGHELGHAWLAQGMVARGWIVLTLRHTADNYQDRSAIARADFFEQRARQLSRVLDQLLADARWRDLIDPTRIAAFGHSAGGHSVLALAGARPDPARVVAHCSPGGAGLVDDTVMCGLGGTRSTDAAAVMQQTVPMDTSDPRIAAVVVAAPLVVPLQQASLQALRVPVWVEAAGRDEVLTARHHALTLCGRPHVQCHVDVGAGHFASFHAGTGPLPADGIDPAYDPPGFDRLAWQRAALQRIAGFLAAALP